MAGLIPGDSNSQGESKERENLVEKLEGKPIEKHGKDAVVSQPQQDKRKAPQKTTYSRRQFHGTDYTRHDVDHHVSEDGERMKRTRHPHRGHWQSRNEPDHWFNGDGEVPVQSYHNALHHRRINKRTGHRSAEPRLASTQGGMKERKKKTIEQETTISSTAEDNGEKIDADKAKVTKAEDQSTVKVSKQSTGNLVADKRGEKTDKRKPYVSKAKPHVSKSKTKDSSAVKVSTQTADNPVTDRSGEKIVKTKPDLDKAEVIKAQCSDQITNNSLNKKEKKQKGPILNNDEATDKEKNMVIMVGKYQVKKFKPISTPDVTVAEENTGNETSNSKVKSDKATNQIVSTHSQHKKRIFYNKMKGTGKHYGGVAASLQSDVLSQQLTTGQYECMVCCDRVRVKDPVWSCSTCYHIFHLKCIKKWAKIPTNIQEG